MALALALAVRVVVWWRQLWWRWRRHLVGAVLVAAAIQGNPKKHLDDCHASRVVGLGR